MGPSPKAWWKWQIYIANKENQVNHNFVANRIINLSRAPSDKQATKSTKSNLRHLNGISTERSTQAAPYSLEEIIKQYIR